MLALLTPLAASFNVPSSAAPSRRAPAGPARAAILRLSGGQAFESEDTEDTHTLFLPIADEVRAKSIDYALKDNVLTLGVSGAEAAIAGEELWGRVIADDCYWEIDELDGKGRCVVLSLQKRDMGRWSYSLKSEYKPPDATVTSKTFLDISVDGEPAGRVVIGLYGNQCPKARVRTRTPRPSAGALPPSRFRRPRRAA